MNALSTRNSTLARPATMPSRGLHRFACLLAGATLLLIAAGGMVTSTGSGLSVPDWPTSYGENMFLFPPAKWVGGILFEHGHRLIASTVGFLTIVLAVWLQGTEPRRWVRRLGWAALAVVILQGLLGGMTVLLRLPTWVSVFHACMAQSFFCIVLTLAVVTGPAWLRRSAAPSAIESKPATRLKRATLALVCVVFIQLFLGAWMRHSQAGLAVPDFPLAYGQVIPGLSDADIAEYNHERAFSWFLPEVTRQQVELHMLHRAGAVIVATTVMLTAIMVFRRRNTRLLHGPMIAVLMLVLGQFALGAWTVLSGRTPWIATAHVATGAALLGAAWLLFLRNSQRSAVMEDLATQPAPACTFGGVAA